MTETKESALSQRVATDIVVPALRSRASVLWIRTPEEARIEPVLFEAAAAAGYDTRFWDVAAGVTTLDGRPERSLDGADADTVFDTIRQRSDGRRVWVMRDLGPWLNPPIGLVTVRKLRNLTRWLPAQPRENAQAVIVLSAAGEVPTELANSVMVIDWPLPDRAEIAAILDATVDALPDDLRGTAVNGQRDAAVDAAIGLSGEETQAAFSRSLVQLRRIDPAVIAQEKRRVVGKSGVLEWMDPQVSGLDDLGGWEEFKDWASSRVDAYTPAARTYGLPAPRGILAGGMSGTGKTLCAKALAAEWGVPLLRLDLGGLKSKFVGESEQNLRKALQTIEAIGRCVVLIDEIEKALAGSTGPQGDGGVSSDALGTLLSWLNDRPGEAFVVATCNDASGLPPELLRRGRFDELWFVDVPNRAERQSVLSAALRSHKRDAAALGIDLDAVADVTDSFTGAEIAALVPDAMYSAFADERRELCTDDLLSAAKQVVPLAKTAAEKVAALRDFWVGRARTVSRADISTERVTAAAVRQLDLN